MNNIKKLLDNIYREEIYQYSDDRISVGDYYVSLDARTIEHGLHYCNSVRLEDICNRFPKNVKKVISTTDANLLSKGIAHY